MSTSPMPWPRPEVVSIAPAYHGAFDYGELEALALNPDEILDFSVNSNPYGPSPQVQIAINHTILDRYPDREALTLRRALAVHLTTTADQIVVTNGTAEALWLIAFACLSPGDPVLILSPTFGEYERLAALMSANINRWEASPVDNFAANLEAIAEKLATVQPKLAFLCNPNNPTGQVVSLQTIVDWAKTNPQTLFVIDESYLAFTTTAESTVTLTLDNIIIVRSMTKDYALAGLRLGYVVSHNQALLTAIRQS
ncbi:MAG: histidinol-phosphate transaminase, partial [Chloroflexota bacterium]